MGKTSLLRQIELLTTVDGGPYVPLFWDLQGCTNTADLSSELFIALEDVKGRFADAGLPMEILQLKDAVTMLRQISRALRRQSRQLLLLVDEAEVLVEIAQHEPAWLARLRKALQEGQLRSVIASTKLLTQLTEQSSDWMTSPFLFGFHLVKLWALKREGATALVKQSQAAHVIDVNESVLDDILRYTNHHPYLIQYLCQRLFVEGIDRRGRLRPIEDADLSVDHLLAGFFQVDYQRLSVTERKILLAVAEATALEHDALAKVVDDDQYGQLAAILKSLKELGQLREHQGRWEIGNEFLKRWLQNNLTTLKADLGRLVPSLTVQELNESNIQAVARTLGVSADRVKALASVNISGEVEFFAVVCNFFYEIRHLVEQDDGHKLLLDTTPDGLVRLRREEEVQIALKHWLRPMCNALNIDMDREPLTGRGFLDFKFSVGHDFRCLVEVKLFSNPKLQEGLSVQLPLYLLADKARFGIYVPIFLESSAYATQLEKLRTLAEATAASHMIQIEVIDIRAWKPKSASKASQVEGANRYHLDPGRLNGTQQAGKRTDPADQSSQQE